jgi:GTP cyclohydrolase I
MHLAWKPALTCYSPLGEDVTRDGLVGTPKRVAKALLEMTQGYREDPAVVLGTVFDQHYDELVILQGIQFHSTCEHHLLPFIGEAIVAYRPGKVVGISKLARLVQVFARRLQIQERMTQQIAEAIERHLDARAVGVVIKAKHLCMACRGVKQEQTEMITSDWRGGLQDAAQRQHFWQLVRLMA